MPERWENISEPYASAGSFDGVFNHVFGDWAADGGIGNLPGYCGVGGFTQGRAMRRITKIGVQWRMYPGGGNPFEEGEPPPYPGAEAEIEYNFFYEVYRDETATGGPNTFVYSVEATEAGLLVDGAYHEFVIPETVCGNRIQFGRWFDANLGLLDVEYAEITLFTDDIPGPPAPTLHAAGRLTVGNTPEVFYYGP